MRALVTGATGFVGQALCERMLSEGYSVSATGRSCTPALLEDIEYVATDLMAEAIPDSLFEMVDCVVHLAGLAHLDVGLSVDEFRCINVAPTLTLAQQAIDAGVRRFVFVSSIGVHGAESEGSPITELSPLAPVTEYAVSKLEAEQKLDALFAHSKNAELVIVRPPLVYGATARGSFGKLLGLASSGLPLPFGCCTNRRSLISLDNLTRFLVACCSDSAAAGETFVVSDGGEPVSTAEIVSNLRSGMERPARLLPIPLSLMKLMMGLMGKQGMYGQLYGDLHIDSGKAVERLAWAPGRDSRIQLQEVGRQYVDVRY